MLKYLWRVALGLSLLAVAPAAFSQAEVEYPVFDGVWETGWGRMALWQAADAVWGVFGSRGEIGGHVTQDGRFQFFWENGPDAFGTGWLDLGENGDRFEGRWFNDADISEHGSLEGDFLWANTFEIGDREVLTYEPGESPPPAITAPAAATGEAESPEVPLEEAAEPPMEPEFHGDSTGAWSGTWDTGRGYLVLAAADGEAIGSFGENGVLDGTVEGATLTATWTTTGDDGVSLSGEAIFWLDEDGATFRGTYNSSDEPDVWRVWSGVKVSESSESPEVSGEEEGSAEE